VTASRGRCPASPVGRLCPLTWGGDQREELGRLYRAIRRANAHAPVTEWVGRWRHSREMHATARLPLALVKLKLIQLDEPLPSGAQP
jgi:hypothetical protein